jgi:hypothetical protein
LSLERRKQLLRLATEHDLLIIEDDPYYYLQFGDRLPSLFSMCTDGRVIRCAKNATGGSEACMIQVPAPFAALSVSFFLCGFGVHAEFMSYWREMLRGANGRWNVTPPASAQFVGTNPQMRLFVKAAVVRHSHRLRDCAGPPSP